MNLNEFRNQFPIFPERGYLYSGALAPAARSVQQALTKWTDQWALDPIACYDGMAAEVETTKELFARLIHADSGGVFITDNTSRGSEFDRFGRCPSSGFECGDRQDDVSKRSVPVDDNDWAYDSTCRG